MRRLVVPLFVMLASCASAGSAQAVRGAGAAALQPIGKWSVDYGIDECRLVRSFARGDVQATVQFALNGPYPDTPPELTVLWPAMMASPSARTGKVPFDVTIDSAFSQQSAMAWVLPGTTPATSIVYVEDTAAFADAIAADAKAGRPTLLTMTHKQQTITIALDPLERPFAALHACMDAQVRVWGYDPAVLRGLSQRPRPVGNPGEWFKASDMPNVLTNEEQTAGVQVRLDIDIAGTIVGCHILRAGGNAQYQALTCDLFRKRGRFKPALDAAGQPVSSVWISRVFWSG
jgi:hypothetical protein